MDVVYHTEVYDVARIGVRVVPVSQDGVQTEHALAAADIFQ